MPRGRKPRTWVKMDCEGVLRGSINYLLSLEGQAVWLKMIAFSEVCGGRPGFIEDNNNIGLPLAYIAQELHCPLNVLENVVEVMENDGAISRNGTGSIELVNFKIYQFTEYDRQRPYRETKKQAEDMGLTVKQVRAYKEFTDICNQEHRELTKQLGREPSGEEWEPVRARLEKEYELVKKELG